MTSRFTPSPVVGKKKAFADNCKGKHFLFKKS